MVHGVCAAATCGGPLRTSAPLCRLLLLLLTRHGGRIARGSLQRLAEAAAATACFMTKKCVAEASKLLQGADGS